MRAPRDPDSDERLAPEATIPVATPPAEGERAPPRGLFGGAAIDVSPLRRRELRLLFVGQLVSFFGSMITYVALPYQVFAITRSSLAVGLLGLAELGPLLVTAFIGGALADARDRRRMVELTEVGLALGSVALAINAALPHPRLAPLYVIAGWMAALNGLQRPSLDALVPRLVPWEELQAAVALSALKGNVGMIGGPAAGGALIATFGLSVTYGIDVVTFVISLAALASMRPVPPPKDAAAPSVEGIREGIRYALARPELLGTYLVDLVAMIFGMPIALFPALAADLGGPGVLGLLYAAPAAGALLATLTSGWTARVHRHGLAVLIAATVWGGAIVLVGASPSLPLTLAFLMIAGGADMVSGLFRGTIWNQTIPDALRGRLAGIELVSYSSGPLLGNVESGVAAAIAGARISVISGGAICVLGVVACALCFPAFRRYDARAAAPR